MGTRTGKSAQIYEAFYVANSDVNGGSYTLGDVVSDAHLNAATFKEIKVSSDFSSLKLDDREPLVQAQYSEEILDDFSQPGLDNFEAQLEIFNHPNLMTNHEDFIGSGLGEINDLSSLTDTLTTVTDQHTFVVTPGSWGSAKPGDIIDIAGVPAAIVSVDNVTGDLVVANDIGGLVGGEAVTGSKTVFLKEFQDNEYYHFLFVTSIGTFVAQWVKPAFTFSFEPNTLRNWVIKLRGDNARYNANVTKSTVASITSESKSIASAPNYKRVHINDTTKDSNHTRIMLNLDREQKVIPQEGTEWGNGFGGVAQDKVLITGEIEFFNLIPTALRSNYDDGDKIYLFAFNKDNDLAFYSDGVGIKQIQHQTIDEGEARPKLLFAGNEKEGGVITMRVS